MEKLFKGIIIVGGVLLIILAMAVNKSMTDKAIEKCVAGGHSVSYCENKLN